MAIGFGSTFGAGSTDVLTAPGAAYALSSTTGFTVSVRFNMRGSGGGGFGRVCQHGYLAFATAFNINYRGDVGQVMAIGTATDGNELWVPIAACPFGADNHIVFTAHPTTRANHILHVNGNDFTGVSGAGTGNLFKTNLAITYVGNRQDGARVITGTIESFAWWDSMLTAAEHIALYKGESPLNIRRDTLRHYLPMSHPHSAGVDLAGEVDFTRTGTIPAADRLAPVQPRRQSVFLPSWMSGGDPPSPSPLAVFRNHYVNQGIA